MIWMLLAVYLYFCQIIAALVAIKAARGFVYWRDIVDAAAFPIAFPIAFLREVFKRH